MLGKAQLYSQNYAEYIFIIRGEKALFDFTLAKLYNIETRVLKQQVKRNIERFPEDFMIQLSKAEWEEVITNCDNLLGQHKYSPIPPLAFTEQGVAMLSGVLRSKKAIEVNIEIMRAFVHMRKLMDGNKELKEKIEQLEKKFDAKFKAVFSVIKNLINQESKPRNFIGFKTK